MSVFRRVPAFLLSVTLAAAFAPLVRAHCQIPCGIYDDETRFTEMLEHVTTIEKSIGEIVRIGKEAKPDWNQLVRWVENKDHHADELSEVVTYYFMAQRIKPPAADAAEAGQKKYATELALLHRMLIEAMKSKQTTDTAHTDALRKAIGEFRASYSEKKP
jgi:nickel superoxide dismutase